MGFGSLPGNGEANLVSLANNVIRILKLKLDYPDEEGEENAKNKGKEKLESADDQKLEEKEIQKGKGKLEIDDDQKMKEKAMQKGKEKVEVADDPEGEEMARQKGEEILEYFEAMLEEQERLEMAKQKGKEILEVPDDQELKEEGTQKGKEKMEVSDDQELKEKAKQKGKGKLEIAGYQKGKEVAKKKGEKVKKVTIKLPVLENLLDIRYVELLEEKIMKEKEDQEEEEKKKKKKKAMAALTEKFNKAMKFFRKNKNDNADERKFSRYFLEVVLMCLDEQNLTTAKQILEHPFFQQPIDVQKFERRIRMGAVL